MSDQTIVAFPGRDFQSWFNWVQCELSILGFDIAKHSHDWRLAFERGLRPETAAGEAARLFEEI